MKIRFIRHSKVLFDWNVIYDSSSFDLACLDYDSSPVQRGQKIEFVEKIAYISNLRRSEETANALFYGGIDVVKTDLLNEIPLRSFMDTKIKLPVILWMIAGRLQWYLNSSRQAETRKESRERINSFLDHIDCNQQDCIIIGHGFYFSEMITEMKKRKIMGDMRKRIKNEESREFIHTIIQHKVVESKD